jgi:hypothetical protein
MMYPFVRLMFDRATVTGSGVTGAFITDAAEGICNLTEEQHKSTIHGALHCRRGRRWTNHTERLVRRQIPVGSGCPEMDMTRYSVFSNDHPKVVKLRS